MTNNKSHPVIIAAKRTPVGKFLGGLSRVPATTLGSIAIEAAIQDSGVSAEAVDECIMGCVLQAGLGQNPARQAGLGAGLPESLSAVTVNKVCGSGLQSVMQASQSIRASDNNIVIAGGMENMSASPHLAHVRSGLKFGPGEFIDHMQHDGLTCPFEGWGMGSAAEWIADTFSISREQQDEFSAKSHARAATAIKNGWFDDETVALDASQIKQRQDVNTDEGVRGDSTAEGLSKLRTSVCERRNRYRGERPHKFQMAAQLLLLQVKQQQAIQTQTCWQELLIATHLV